MARALRKRYGHADAQRALKLARSVTDKLTDLLVRAENSRVEAAYVQELAAAVAESSTADYLKAKKLQAGRRTAVKTRANVAHLAEWVDYPRWLKQGLTALVEDSKAVVAALDA